MISKSKSLEQFFCFICSKLHCMSSQQHPDTAERNQAKKFCNKMDDNLGRRTCSGACPDYLYSSTPNRKTIPPLSPSSRGCNHLILRHPFPEHHLLQAGTCAFCT